MVLPACAADSPAVAGDALLSVARTGLGETRRQTPLAARLFGKRTRATAGPGGSLSAAGTPGRPRTAGCRPPGGLLAPRRFPGPGASPARSPGASCPGLCLLVILPKPERVPSPDPSPAPQCPLVKPRSSAWPSRPLIPVRLHPESALARPLAVPGSRCVSAPTCLCSRVLRP